MKVIIEIDDKEISQQVEKIVTEQLARDILGRDGNRSYYFRKDVKEIIRSILRENMEEISDRAVAAAAKSIENRGIKKMLEAEAERENRLLEKLRNLDLEDNRK